jgi:phenylacetate-CoA ligase
MEIADIYGSAEAGRIAAGCRRRDGLHLEDDAIIVEFLRDGLPVQPGEQGSAVVTCLDQLNMPLIRYEQGDLCILRRKPCDCGWATPLIEAPLGRQADMVTLPDGRKVSALVLDVTLRTNIDIVQYRFVQHARNLIELEICFGEPRSGQALDELRRSIEQAVGQGIEFRITVMPGMRFEGTKFKSFVSRL